MTPENTIFTDLLECLGVKHTVAYSNAQFHAMSFSSLFGLSRLLGEYGVESAGYRVGNPEEIERIRPPFVAQTRGGFVIVTSFESGNIKYMTQGVNEVMPLDDFKRSWTGVVFVAVPTAAAAEPDYALHAREDFFNRAKKWVLIAAMLFLLAYAVIADGWYRHPAVLGVMAFDIIGLTLSFMLVQKSLKIKTKAADKVCGVLQEGGCDDILASSASKFFGLFGWSEVGFAYFSVSLSALLLFPSSVGVLALCNLCCLPFTVWSLWYQRFRAHHWCTLCVGVQMTLWCLFFCYLAGGYVSLTMFRIDWMLIVLGTCYLAVLLGLNALSPYIHKANKNNDNDE